MKKKVLIFWISALCCGYLQAQPSLEPTVTKPSFDLRVAQFASSLSQRGYDKKSVELWNEVHAMIIDEFAQVKRKIADAVVAGNSAEKDQLDNLHIKQVAAYNKIIAMRNNSFSDAQSIEAQLHEYSKLIM